MRVRLPLRINLARLLLLMSGVLIFFPSVNALPLPLEYTATFSARYNGLPIETTRTLDVTAGQIQVSMEFRSLIGYIKEKETLSIDENGDIAPHHYRYERSILGKKRQEITDFDNTKKTVNTVYKDKSASFELAEDLLAPLSYQLKLRQLILQGQNAFVFKVVYRNAIREFRFEIVEEQDIDTPLGSLHTVLVKRIRENSTRETYLWLAKTLDYLPVKLLQKEDGETYDMLITTYKAKS